MIKNSTVESDKKRVRPLLAVVCPCYNEEEVLEWSVNHLTAKLNELKKSKIINVNSFIILVDDGSLDSTWSIIEKLQNQTVIGLKLSQNVGHQKALLAGLHYATDLCDCCISIDVDLQDDISVFEEMLEHFQRGSELVFGVKKNREVDSFMKQFFAQSYYKFVNFLGIKTIYNHADFRLHSQKVLKILNYYEENNLYLRGFFSNLKVNSSEVFYAIKTRKFGTTKYSVQKMLNLAWNGITSLSILPLRLVSLLGIVVFILSTFLSFYVLWVRLFENTVVGWASTVLPIYFLGGIQLLAIGIIGEYLAKVFSEVKKRPLYIIEKIIDNQKNLSD